ncbi:MAG TPA: S41 family peptidase [Bryobacteraceae bacterium]|nr:S41 family peptidase [Bryobacteraceae bacterium]
MLSRCCLVLAVAAVYACAQPALPDTPAGRTFKAWLDAFNSGDRAQIDAYYRKYQPAASAERDMPIRASTGGFDLVSIDMSERLHLEVQLKGRKGDGIVMSMIDVKDEDPAVVAGFGLRALPRGVTAADFKIDAATIPRVIDGAITNLNEFYVFPDTARKMEEMLRDRQKRGEYDSVTNGSVLASTLTRQLQEVSHDKHLRVDFSPVKLPTGEPGANPQAAEQNRRQMERLNCGFEKVEHLAGNVGYVKFNMFADPAVCGPTATAAMNFLAHVDAVIFDLRDNGGGQPKMVAYISSYLFSKRTHLNDLWTRKSGATEEFWTLDDVVGKRLDTQPAFVLTSSRTFSGGEEFTYNLKNLKRATIVGETTGGGAHPVAGHRIDDHFMIGVPFARAINPITKTNWEGTGVEPDVKVPAADALATAQKLAAEKLAALRQ